MCCSKGVCGELSSRTLIRWTTCGAFRGGVRVGYVLEGQSLQGWSVSPFSTILDSANVFPKSSSHRSAGKQMVQTRRRRLLTEKRGSIFAPEKPTMFGQQVPRTPRGLFCITSLRSGVTGSNHCGDDKSPPSCIRFLTLQRASTEAPLPTCIM